MKKTKLCAFTLKLSTIERLNKLAKEKSINKSGFIDRIINEEIDKENGKKQK